ncbi:hypothetical protein [Burkholderia plantarii]|uniref:hypothetical protein n=1 Tax=Burkholderia plantarii TaxID=41899 RepID=UPI000F4E8AC2|nr:hypothetical protein [Burkholderia plantarii]
MKVSPISRSTSVSTRPRVRLAASSMRRAVASDNGVTNGALPRRGAPIDARRSPPSAGTEARRIATSGPSGPSPAWDAGPPWCETDAAGSSGAPGARGAANGSMKLMGGAGMREAGMERSTKRTKMKMNTKLKTDAVRHGRAASRHFS